MRPAVLVTFAALLAGAVPTAAAPTKVCTVLSDPAGDVVLTGGVGTPDTHIDLRAVLVQTSRSGLTFRIRDTALTDGRLGEWLLTFNARGARLFVGAGREIWVNADDYHGTFGFTAGIQGGRTKQVTDTFDYGASVIRVEVPYTAFGASAPRRGDTLHAVALDSRETFVNGGPAPISVADHASARSSRLTGC